MLSTTKIGENMLSKQLTVNQAGHMLLSDDYANWSYEGAMALAEYIDDLYDDCGAPEFGFDVVAIRCDYSEMKPYDMVASYGYMLDRNLPSDPEWAENCDEVMEELLESIRDNSHCLIELDNGNYIVSQF